MQMRHTRIRNHYSLKFLTFALGLM